MARQSQGNNLPTFSGSPEEWPVFKSLYDSSTISCRFKNTENLARLQRCLKGEAKNMVQSLLSVPDNVPAIIRTLEMRYGRPDIIIRALVAKVTALQPISDNRLSDLLDFAAAVQNLVTTIKSVNAQAHLNNPSLMTELVTRLPPSLRLPWGQQVAQLGPTKVNLHDFSTWLSEVATALSFVIEPKQTPTASPLTGSALLAGNMTNFKKPFQQVDEIICVICGKSGHYTDECKRYRSLEDRRQQLTKQHRCYMCLSKRHTKAHCTTSRLCVHCKKAGCHHRSLCPVKFGRPALPNSTNTPATPAQKAESASKTSTTTEPASLITEREAVRMQTATAQVANLRRLESTITARIRFDSGSYRTYITEELAEKLKLRCSKPEHLQLATFGSSSVQHVSARSADITLHLANKEMWQLRVTVVPNITTNITTAPLDQNLKLNLPRDIHIAETEYKASQTQGIDILIGNDNYLELVPERHQLAPGLYALNTSLGWIVSGRTHLLPAEPSQMSTPSLLVIDGCQTESNVMDKPQLERFWNLETIGIYAWTPRIYPMMKPPRHCFRSQ